MKRKNAVKEIACMLAREEIDSAQMMANKYLEMFLLMDGWTHLKQEGKCLSSYFMKEGYKRIAIYGISYVGKTLIKELKESDIEIVCGIDRNKIALQDNIKVVEIGEKIDGIDAVVVTPITYFDEIETELEKYLDCPILSIKDILFEVECMK